MQWAFMYLQAMPYPCGIYPLLLKVFDFNVPEIFSVGAKGMGGVGGLRGLFYCESLSVYVSERETTYL
jgi:hypothetical protein